MEATTEADDLSVQNHRVRAVDRTGEVQLALDDLQSSLWGLERRLQDVQGPYAAELRTMLNALRGTMDRLEEAHESAQAVHEAAK